MQAFKLASRLITLGLILANSGLSIDKQIYSYDSKRNVKFIDLIKQQGPNILVIDEKCSVCESLLVTLDDKIHENIVLAVVNEPSFKWRAKLKRQRVKNMLYNIKSLNIDLSKGTPQLLKFNNDGKLIEQIYGKSKIIESFK